jgi:hypothetical protein
MNRNLDFFTQLLTGSDGSNTLHRFETIVQPTSTRSPLTTLPGEGVTGTFEFGGYNQAIAPPVTPAEPLWMCPWKEKPSHTQDRIPRQKQFIKFIVKKPCHYPIGGIGAPL